MAARKREGGAAEEADEPFVEEVDGGGAEPYMLSREIGEERG